GIFEKLDNMLNYLQEQLGRWVFNIFQKVAGRQSRAEDNIRKWAKENNKNEDEAIKFYNENKNKNRWTNQTANFGRKDGGSFFAGYNDIYFSEHMNDMLKEFNGNVSDVEGTSAIGYPALRYPGTSGFIKGPSHFNGGIKGLLRGQMWENEGDEYTVNKSSSRRYRGILSQINNGTFNPYSYAKDLIKNNMPKLYDTLSVAKGGMSKYTNDVQSLFSGNRNINGTIKVDIPQTITLNLAGAGKIGDYDVSGLVKQLVDSMMKEWLMRQNFSGFDKENFPMKIVT
ncbi:MAG: hypothetical protein J6X18_07885, partial [Bacteroidales bacterium]|nr:hypothetical protein [Bacteroidales bacterium]